MPGSKTLSPRPCHQQAVPKRNTNTNDTVWMRPP